MKRDLSTIAHCDICGEPIHYGDERFDMPDGNIICTDDPVCLLTWADKYKVLGEVPLW